MGVQIGKITRSQKGYISTKGDPGKKKMVFLREIIKEKEKLISITIY